MVFPLRRILSTKSNLVPLVGGKFFVSIYAPLRLISRSLHFFISLPSLANTFTSVTRRAAKRRLARRFPSHNYPPRISMLRKISIDESFPVTTR